MGTYSLVHFLAGGVDRLSQIRIGMVLEAAVKRLAFVLAGTIIFGLVAYASTNAFGYWYGPRYIKSDSDINDIYIVFLIILVVGIIGGGFIGNWAYGRNNRDQQ